MNTELEVINPAYTASQAIANLQQKEDPSARYYAAWWIGRFQVKEPIVITALLEALQDETDRSPDGGYPLRRNAAKALGKLGDLTVVPNLIQILDCEDYYVRESAAYALAQLKDSRAIAPLSELLKGGLEAAQKVADKPHLAQPYEAVLEALGELQAQEARSLIEPFLDHFSPKVQYAAARSLYQLTQNAVYAERLISVLQGKDLQLRRSAMMDLGATGYLPGATAIAATLAENSLKLIAIKNLWERYQEKHTDEPLLSPATVQVMTLMDELL